MRHITTLFSLLLLSACSTVIDKSQQEITIETPGAQEALCMLENRDMKYKVRAPDTIMITKTQKPINVRCLAPGNREKTIVLEPEISENAIGNIATGVLPGLFVDYETASMYKFPEVVSVDFTDVPAKRMPLPAYQQLLNENPMLMEMEEFRPGRSALQRDRYQQTPTLQRIDREGALIEQTSEMTDVTGGTFTVQDSSASSSSQSQSTAESLTHSMNPQVFAPSASETSVSPSYGGVQRDSQGYEVPASTGMPTALTPEY